MSAAAEAFGQAGFEPIYVEHREDGDVSFWFSTAVAKDLEKLLKTIPLDFYALQAVIR